MTLPLSVVLLALAKIVLLALVTVYFGLVLTAYRMDGIHHHLGLDLQDPARSLERLLVWAGVWALYWTLMAGRSLFNTLSEASAEVGEWFLRRRSPRVQEAIRSRVMI